MSSYRLELLVSDSAAVKALYAGIATEDRPNDNAGVDLFVATEARLSGHRGCSLIDLGVKARMVNLASGEDVHYLLYPRSSIFKSNVYIANSVGVIDRTYRGTLKAAVGVLDIESGATLAAGIRLVQVVAPDMGHIKQIRLVESLPETVRGAGGFGSTGS
jgi:deoxyuridine 5'-triphosphate nucleotidohydrolase